MAELSARTPPATRWLMDAVLRSYAQIFFSEHRLAGLLLFAATLLRPWLGLMGLLGVLGALLAVRVLGFSLDSARHGLFGFNALFLGLALGAWFEPGMAPVVVLGVGVVAVVYLQVALQTALGYHLALPALSLPFVLVAYALLLALRSLPGLAWAPPPEIAASAIGGGLGAILFQPSVPTSALVLLAVAVSSRIAAVLAAIGLAAAGLVLPLVPATPPAFAVMVSANALLVSIALGGIWFVPQRSALLLGVVGATLAAFTTLSASTFLTGLGLPVLVLPFNLTVLVVVYAMRQRGRDAAPRTVDFVAGSPEVNLSYYRTRIARFGAHRATRLALPFSGRWTITQGVDGAHTHREAWRHALDFEVWGEDGRAHERSGAELGDYRCYRLPVLAPADGRVVKVVRDVPDNRPGERNPDDPWGNLVLIQHSPGLHSLVCHLAPGTIDVNEGQQVRAGARLGLAGNSGRSFVPHLHFQLQTSPRIGAPTLELELHDIVEQSPDGERLRRACTPKEHAKVRNLERQADLAKLFELRPGKRLHYELTDARGRARNETLTAGIDLYNNLYLESSRDGRLYYEAQPRQFIVFDHQGPRDGVLFMLYLALLRVPFELGPDLVWDDVVPKRHLHRRAWRWIDDLIAPFSEGDELTVEFRGERSSAGAVIRGHAPELETRAVVTAAGPAELEVSLRGLTKRARLVRGAP